MKLNIDSIPKTLERFPNAHISITPTPIYKLSHLSELLGHNIFIMREDLTGFHIGGNKTRKLDYLIGDAMAKKADTLLATGACSFTLNAAAAGKIFGLEVHVVIAGNESQQNKASQTLFKRVETNLHYGPENDEKSFRSKYDEVMDRLKNQGKKVYELVPGGSDSIGALGYINTFHEIIQYSQNSGIHFNKIILPTGSTATQVGLILGQSISEYRTKIIGMAISQEANIQYQRIRKLALSTAKMLEIQIDEKSILVEDKFMGRGYSIPTKKGEQAVKMFAIYEGILLDQVYTGKAAAGLIDYAKNHMFDPEDNILFIHTGGNAGLFY